MKIKGDTRAGYVANNEVKSLRILTEPNNLGEFLEIQVAEQWDGSLILVFAGETSAELTQDQKGFGHLRVWPTAKKTGG